MPDFALYVGAALFAVMGVGALAAPDRVTAQFGIPPLSLAGRNEVRAVYGGFGVAMAGLLIVASLDDTIRDGVAVAVAVALVGMAVGRLISAIVDRSLPATPLVYLVVELVAAALVLFGGLGV